MVDYSYKTHKLGGVIMGMSNNLKAIEAKNWPEIATAYSLSSDEATAVKELRATLPDENNALIMLYCSADYDLQALSRALQSHFPNSRIVGCTTAGEITPVGYKKNSITAFCLPSASFSVETTLIEGLAGFTREEAEQLVRDMLASLEKHTVAPIKSHSFALSLLDGMSISEELILSSLSSALNTIPLVGGSAGDNLQFRDTHVFFDGKFHSHAAVLVLVNTICPFEVISEHHLVPEDEKLVVTEADPYKRIVREFNAEPAALEYCRVMGLSLDQLQAKTYAMHPLAVQLGDKLYIRSVQQVNDDLSLKFFCAVDLGIVLTKMRSDGIVEHSESMLFEVSRKIGHPQLVIGYDCIHRRIEVEELRLQEQISQLYKNYNVIGFNTYGEQHSSMHLNHTFTGIAVGGMSGR